LISGVKGSVYLIWPEKIYLIFENFLKKRCLDKKNLMENLKDIITFDQTLHTTGDADLESISLG
jgi:hypothetical protein